MSKFPTPEIKGKTVLIVGYGREGRSVHRFLNDFYPKIQVAIADKQPLTDIALPTDHIFEGKDYLDHLADFETVVRSPGISVINDKLKSYIKSGGWVTSATNIFLSLFHQQVIGVTGSKGKSTTSALIWEILKDKFDETQLVGNIGRPALDIVEKINSKTKIVMELSSHQLVDTRYSPHMAVILRLFPEHLDYYSNYQAYIKAKLNITKWHGPNDLLIINQNDSELLKQTKDVKSIKFLFSLKKSSGVHVWVENGQIMFKQNNVSQSLMKTAAVKLKGESNLENVLAAVSVAIINKVPQIKIKRAIKKFSGLPHRLEFVGTYKGIDFYNDSLATAPEATIAACEALKNDVETLILGGFDRKLDQEKLIKYLIQKPSIKYLILFPQTGFEIGQSLARKRNDKNIFYVRDMKSAVKIAFEKTTIGKICLLSPAAASFNLFKDYADRGDQFKKFVKYYGGR